MSDTIDLFSNEENEITFQLMIEGTTSDGSIDKPVMRFHLEEGVDDGGMSYTFPVSNDNKDEVSVVIPPLENVITEGKHYTGRLEVIIGNRYFVPTEVGVLFKKALRVESKTVSVSHKQKRLTESTPDSTPVVSAGKVKSRTTAKRRKPPQQKTQPASKKRQLTPEQRREILRRRQLEEASSKKKSSLRQFLKDALED